MLKYKENIINVMKKRAKKAVGKKAIELNLRITPLSHKLLRELKGSKEFKNKNQVIEAAISFFYMWQKLPNEFNKLNELKNSELPMNSHLKHVERLTSDVLLKLPLKKDKKE